MLKFVTRSRLRFGVLAKSLRYYHPTPSPLTQVANTQRLSQPHSRVEWKPLLASLSWILGPVLALCISKRLLANASGEHHLLLALIRLQRMDADYDTYDLNKDEDLSNYLGKVITCLALDPPSQEITRMVKVIKDHNEQLNTTLLRNFLVEVHNIIGQNRYKEPVETSRKVFSALAHLTEELEGERVGVGGSQ